MINSKKIETHEGYIEFREGAKGTYELYDFQIKEELRGHGFGSYLIQKMEWEIGKKNIYLFTRKENVRAHNFYEKHGYKKVAEIPDFYLDNDSPVWGRRSGDVYMYLKRI